MQKIGIGINAYQYTSEEENFNYTNNFGCDLIVYRDNIDYDKEQLLVLKNAYAYKYNLPINGFIVACIQELNNEYYNSFIYSLLDNFLHKESPTFEYYDKEKENVDKVEEYIKSIKIYTTENIEFEVIRKELSIKLLLKRLDNHKKEFISTYNENEKVYLNFINNK